MVKESKHKHGEGESRDNCKNCAAERLVGQLTGFELFSLAWFRTNVSQFTFDAHLIGDLIKELELKDITRRLFLKILSMIHSNDMEIAQARATKERNK